KPSVLLNTIHITRSTLFPYTNALPISEQEDPVAEGVESRERDVARADLERDDEVEERGRQRHQREEDHRRAVHREQLIERLRAQDRKSTRLNSSHQIISYAVFCLKTKK